MRPIPITCSIQKEINLSKTLQVKNELIPVIQSDSTLSILQLTAASKQGKLLDADENQFNLGD